MLESQRGVEAFLFHLYCDQTVECALCSLLFLKFLLSFGADNIMLHGAALMFLKQYKQVKPLILKYCIILVKKKREEGKISAKTEIQSYTVT